MYASTNINKLNVSTITIAVFLMHQNQNRYNNSNECHGNNYHQAYTHSHIAHLHSIHNQGIFTEFPVSLLQLSTFETLLP